MLSFPQFIHPCITHCRPNSLCQQPCSYRGATQEASLPVAPSPTQRGAIRRDRSAASETAEANTRPYIIPYTIIPYNFPYTAHPISGCGLSAWYVHTIHNDPNPNPYTYPYTYPYAYTYTYTYVEYEYACSTALKSIQMQCAVWLRCSSCLYIFGLACMPM